MTDDRFRSAEGAREVREEYARLLSAYLPDVERTVVDGTHVLSAGPADAPPVVLLHGSGGTSLNWATEIPRLARTHRVHALDLPGEPGGTVVPRLPLEPGAHAAWLAGATDALGAPHAAVIGESLGGWVALDYATEHPTRIRSLGLLVPGGLGPRRTAPLLVAGLLSLLGRPGRRAAMRYFTGWSPSNEPGLERDLAVFSDLTFRAFRPRTDGLPRLRRRGPRPDHRAGDRRVRRARQDARRSAGRSARAHRLRRRGRHPARRSGSPCTGPRRAGDRRRRVAGPRPVEFASTTSAVVRN
ncbi:MULTISPECIES: alpha/beta fold hydrolase [Tsukamurella]|uniref:Alpha/beta fold hydrolase n=2 Tax=Tsukamurella TaxID=2060 RepID=A0A5C5RWL9_9ACTN|nr:MULTISPECIES: alpha/beta fold hydrolase [Tsukamurella]NMD56639.1 alpha/beta fold hydrolase [Tsukamurella columbiensis]TWS27437.1 alpha/beta fold hydrolase [Tsukamurella conjunctivitidis]